MVFQSSDFSRPRQVKPKLALHSPCACESVPFFAPSDHGRRCSRKSERDNHETLRSPQADRLDHAPAAPDMVGCACGAGSRSVPEAAARMARVPAPAKAFDANRSQAPRTSCPDKGRGSGRGALPPRRGPEAERPQPWGLRPRAAVLVALPSGRRWDNASRSATALKKRCGWLPMYIARRRPLSFFVIVGVS